MPKPLITPENRDDFYLTTDQIDKVLDKLVPLIAKPEDHEFMRGVLRICAEEWNAPKFAAFVAKLLREASDDQDNHLGR